LENGAMPEYEVHKAVPYIEAISKQRVFIGCIKFMISCDPVNEGLVEWLSE
jgi:hypothetical protein